MRDADGGTYDMRRHFFPQWATAYFPLCAWFNSPYAYHVRVISLFIAILLSRARHVLPLHACGSCLAAGWRFKRQLQMANCCNGLLHFLRETDGVCVFRGDRLDFFFQPISLSGFFFLFWKVFFFYFLHNIRPWERPSRYCGGQRRQDSLGLLTSNLVRTPREP